MQDVKQLSPSLAHLKKIVTTGRKQRVCEETFAANLPCLKKREAVTLAGTPRACFASVLTPSSEQVVARRRFCVFGVFDGGNSGDDDNDDANNDG